ncbi:hypothetical protein NP233_g8815 [Leucocoprinus birnbaumii]|uniref:Zinc/iron permease n=1 Tax=Leucocoprinus birnbaumii TaxID=56174 RepID=A0AAD5YNQ8_9AGAR|nr:hypothetical protein NP233_g8815 [Leucocoprinus birnbaumii]
MAVTTLDRLRSAEDHVMPVEPRLQVLAVILIISLFAVSFPGVSKSLPFLRIPPVVFFIGKHFGTGVILATAFIHLLQDSFEALQKPLVRQYFSHVGKYTGLIILASLLSIFLVEYISTSYVESLQAEPSLPPTPVSSRPPSPHHSQRCTLKGASTPPTHPAPVRPPTSLSVLQAPIIQTSQTDETTPLLRHPRTQSTPHLNTAYGHANHRAHHALLPAIVTQNAAGVVPIEVLTNSPRILRMRGCTCVLDHGCVCAASAHTTHPHTPLPSTVSREPSRTEPSGTVGATVALVEEERGSSRSSGDAGSAQEVEPSVGRRRQVIGLLVLQLGIMIHSIVIGLTLAITTGADFTSLTTAVIFHQLFEGLSLGIRIATLPPPPSNNDDETPLESGDPYKPEHRRRGFVKNIISKIGGERGEGWLKCSLAILFAITTPAGMGLGMVAFKVGRKKAGIELARMYLTQGIMSAISAGMLIYVSTVEMIAGDFVFGDVEGHSHHGHGHSHDLPSMEDEERALPDQAQPIMGRPFVTGPEEIPSSELQENQHSAEELDEHHHHHHHAKIGKKMLAVLSLLAGVGGMVLVGLGE